MSSGLRLVEVCLGFLLLLLAPLLALMLLLLLLILLPGLSRALSRAAAIESGATIALTLSCRCCAACATGIRGEQLLQLIEAGKVAGRPWDAKWRAAGAVHRTRAEAAEKDVTKDNPLLLASKRAMPALPPPSRIRRSYKSVHLADDQGGAQIVFS